jgi:hypothetical protein
MRTESAPPNARPKAPGRVVDWFAENPRVALIGTTASIIGLVLTLIFFFLSRRERDIRYATSASPTTIVRNGQSSDLKVHFKDKEVTSDVSSIQIAIWNAGNETVRRDNILSKQVAIKFDPRTAILEARVEKVTRTLTNVYLDSSDSSRGILYCSWDVLERGDGVLLDVIYVGTSGKVVVEGAIEGQMPIRRVILGREASRFTGQELWGIVGLSFLIGLLRATIEYRAHKEFVGSRDLSASLRRWGEIIRAIASCVQTSIIAFALLFLVVGVARAFMRPAVPFVL